VLAPRKEHLPQAGGIIEQERSFAVAYDNDPSPAKPIGLRKKGIAVRQSLKKAVNNCLVARGFIVRVQNKAK
jgi:hypothetical protein